MILVANIHPKYLTRVSDESVNNDLTLNRKYGEYNYRINLIWYPSIRTASVTLVQIHDYQEFNITKKKVEFKQLETYIRQYIEKHLHITNSGKTSKKEYHINFSVGEERAKMLKELAYSYGGQLYRGRMIYTKSFKVN